MANAYRIHFVSHADPKFQGYNAKVEKELQCMERHKMITRRELSFKNRTGENTTHVEWSFRHDKIMEFFIVQMFLGNNNPKWQEHLGDSRFSGVYFLLAQMLPVEDAL